MALLSRTDHQTYCPYKGDASYFSLPTGEDGKNGVWTYETPYDAVSRDQGSSRLLSRQGGDRDRRVTGEWLRNVRGQRRRDVIGAL